MKSAEALEYDSSYTDHLITYVSRPEIALSAPIHAKPFGGLLMSEAVYISRHVARLATDLHYPAQPIESFREQDAYVLLGEPGAGKSSLFEREAAALGAGARFTTVREFIRTGLDDADRHRTLFIDAMDEQRAADGLVNQALDRLIAKLDQLGRPRFRLSCRSADWHHLDTTELKAVSGDGQIIELQLQPLNEIETEYLLQSWTPNRLSDPQAFMARARLNGLESMLGNPMLLDLLVRAVSGDAWPASRTEIFQLACQKLAEEHNVRHERVMDPVNTDELLDDAGILCAILLLSDHPYYRILSQDIGGIYIKDLRSRLGISAARVQRALNTPLFMAIGAQRWYRHRSIAEYLAACALVKRVEKGLPISRILALLGGPLNGVVDALRGLYAWLVSMSTHRDVLIQHDVLAVVYYGDVRDFTTNTKQLVFETIHRAAVVLPGLGRRDWQSKAFGALGTPDMEPYLANSLALGQFDDAYEVLLMSILESVEHGQPMPRLLPKIAAIARDGRHWGVVRQAAVDVLIAHSDPQEPYLLPLLDEIRSGVVEDGDDELAGRLLGRLYPFRLSTTTLIREYLCPPRKDNFFGSFRSFWRLELLEKVPNVDAVILADTICEIVERGPMWNQIHDFNDLYYGGILHAAHTLGASMTSEQLYRWLTAGLDEHGYRTREGSRAKELSQWLVDHPEQLQAVYEYGLIQLNARGKMTQHWGWQQTLLNGIQLPDRWYSWLLEVASRHDEEAIVQQCFTTAAWAAANIPDRFPDGLELVYDWLNQFGDRWPASEAWREDETSCPMNDWRRDEQEYQRERAEQIAEDQAKRSQALAPEIAIILTGGVSPGLMHDLLIVMKHGGDGITGDTPSLRVQSFLDCDASTAQCAIDSLDNALDPSEIPSWSEVIERFDNGKKLVIQPVCLAAADKKWGGEDSLCGIAEYPGALSLLAFSLVSGSKPKWFKQLAAAQPNQVATVMKEFLLCALRRQDHRLSAVRWLDDNAVRSDVQAAVLDCLLPKMVPPFAANFPIGPAGAVMQAAIKYASPIELEKWVESALAAPETSPTERAAVLSASLAFSDSRFEELLAFLADDGGRTAVCCQVLDQTMPRVILTRLSIAFIVRLVEQFGRLVSPRAEIILKTGIDDHVRSGVVALLAELASRPVASATMEIIRLRQKSELNAWQYQLSDCQIKSEKCVLDAAFGLVDPLKVVDTLSNREPATERDLVAFVLDHIDTLMRRIRFGGTNMLGIFWREDKDGNRIPHTENVCRDRFLDLLNLEMSSMGVHIGKEQPTAGDKRSDMAIKLTRPGRHMSVPVEVKLDSHPNVWHAWQSQLMALYAPDPDAGYNGVYLVMFAGHKTKVPPARRRPLSAEAMAQVLNELIPASYFGRLHGMVLDFSWV